MKKLISLLLALVMVFALATVASADVDTTKDMQTITITKDYQANGTGAKSPAGTFTFTISPSSVTDAAEGVTVANMPVPTVDPVIYLEGEAGTETSKHDITVTLPTYSSVGIYTYIIKEKADDAAGVTYFGSDIKLVVTVQQGDDGHIRVAAVHTETEEGASKSDEFPNVYNAGTLAVTKNVTGNLGDQQKEFKVSVTFTCPEGKIVKAPITYVEDGVEKTIGGTWRGSKTVEISLKHNETVTFTNIPQGVTYTVKEADYSADGYDAPGYAIANEDGEYGIPSKGLDFNEGITEYENDKVQITNNKGVEVDTGIVLDSMPYVLLLAVAFFGMAMLTKKRRCEN